MDTCDITHTHTHTSPIAFIMRGAKEIQDKEATAPMVMSPSLRKAVSFQTRANMARFRSRRLGPELNHKHFQVELRKAIDSGHSTRILRYATLLGKRRLNTKFEQTDYISPLYYALSIGCEVECTRILVNTGASVNLRVGPYGYTSLHYAIVGGSKDNVRFLVEEGGLQGFTRRKCKLACLDAARLRQQEIFEYLESVDFVPNGKKLASTQKIPTKTRDATTLIDNSAFESTQKTVSTKSRDATTLIDDSVFECGNVGNDPAEPSRQMETTSLHQKTSDDNLAQPSPMETVEPDLRETCFRSTAGDLFPSDEEDEEDSPVRFVQSKTIRRM